jgi:hypothetical protein
MDEEVIPVLRVSNAAAAAAWYERLGFSQEWEHRFEPGFPVFVSVARGVVRVTAVPAARGRPGGWSPVLGGSSARCTPTLLGSGRRPGSPAHLWTSPT